MDADAAKPWRSWAGRRDAKLVLVGEAWGESEAEHQAPFIGASGRLLWQLLGEAAPALDPQEHQFVARTWDNRRFAELRLGWMAQARIAMTNVLAFRPEGNKLDALTVGKKDLPPDYPLPALFKGNYLPLEIALPQLERLRAELAECRPNVVVALGNTACWALLRATNIGSIRGATALGFPALWAGKVLPTYHPAGILRMYSWRPIVLADLMKAGREARGPELVRPRRQVLVNPTLAEVEEFTSSLEANPPPMLACDIETAKGQINCISFAPSPSRALVVPFWQGLLGGNYWPSLREELQVWNCCRRLLALPCAKLGQNFIYDLQYITRMGILPTRCTEDTMLLHHGWFPELQKGLGFLGSVYTDEAPWKLMRRRREDAMEKRDE